MSESIRVGDFVLNSAAIKLDEGKEPLAYMGWVTQVDRNYVSYQPLAKGRSRGGAYVSELTVVSRNNLNLVIPPVPTVPVYVPKVGDIVGWANESIASPDKKKNETFLVGPVPKNGSYPSLINPSTGKSEGSLFNPPSFRLIYRPQA